MVRSAHSASGRLVPNACKNVPVSATTVIAAARDDTSTRTSPESRGTRRRHSAGACGGRAALGDAVGGSGGGDWAASARANTSDPIANPKPDLTASPSLLAFAKAFCARNCVNLFLAATFRHGVDREEKGWRSAAITRRSSG